MFTLAENIRSYFGENIALYFIFLGYYTSALVPPMILGLMEAFIPHTTTVFFCIFNVLWVTLFLEVISPCDVWKNDQFKAIKCQLIKSVFQYVVKKIIHS